MRPGVRWGSIRVPTHVTSIRQNKGPLLLIGIQAGIMPFHTIPTASLNGENSHLVVFFRSVVANSSSLEKN